MDDNTVKDFLQVKDLSLDKAIEPHQAQEYTKTRIQL